MSEYRYTISEMVAMADEAQTPVEKFLRSLAVAEAHRTATEAARRSTEQEKAAIDRVIEELNGEISEEMENLPNEILTKAGVRHNQGTRGYVRRAINLAIAHQKSLARK